MNSASALVFPDYTRKKATMLDIYTWTYKLKLFDKKYWVYIAYP